MREAHLLERIYAAKSALSQKVTIPPGDDMGAIQFGGQTLLIAVDQLADGVHVDSSTMPLAAVGRKAVTRNLSDVAAMAAKPISAVVGASLPRDFGEQRAESLFEAVRQTAEHYECPLIGGDISMWNAPMLLSVTILAEPGGIEPITRTGAAPGDGIYVTGMLGNSFDSGHHLDFEPRIELARQLAGDHATRPHAMIDLSDGLAADLPRICEHGEIGMNQLPIRPGTQRPTWRHALEDGEDYELLFTVPADALAAHTTMLGIPIQRIGTVRDTGGLTLHFPDHTSMPLDEAAKAWEHHGSTQPTSASASKFGALRSFLAPGSAEAWLSGRRSRATAR